MATLVGDFIVPTGAKIHYWSVFDQVVYYMYEESGGNLCLYQLKTGVLRADSPTNMSISEAGLKSIQITDGVSYLQRYCDTCPHHLPQSLRHEKYKFLMLSTRRVLVVSTYSIAVYDIPEKPESQEAAVRPIWRYPSKVDNRAYNFRSGGFSYDGLSAKPIIWIFDSSTQIHYIQLSESEDPVERHDQFPLKYAGRPAVTRLRAMWMHRSRPKLNVTNVSTLSLQDPLTQGSFRLCLDEEEGREFKSRFAFDETSGRVALIVEEASEELCVYIASIARLEARRKTAGDTNC